MQKFGDVNLVYKTASNIPYKLICSEFTGICKLCLHVNKVYKQWSANSKIGGVTDCNSDRAPGKFREEIKFVPNSLLFCYNSLVMSIQIN